MSEAFRQHGKCPDVYIYDAAMYALERGAHGITCSGQELAYLMSRGVFSDGVAAIVPGIRFNDSPKDEQARTSTIAEAIHHGPDNLHLVVGRIGQDPAGARRMLAEIEIALLDKASSSLD
jgi:orotidine-5'-phosphate decarboxylase